MLNFKKRKHIQTGLDVWRQSTSKVRKERQWLRSQTDQEVRTRADSLRMPRMKPVKKGKAQKRLATAKRGLSFYSDDFA